MQPSTSLDSGFSFLRVHLQSQGAAEQGPAAAPNPHACCKCSPARSV